MRTTRIIVLSFLLAISARARDPQPGADAWLTNSFQMPEPYSRLEIARTTFSALKAEAIARSIHITWQGGPEFAEANVIASTDGPGHWLARDWRTFAMRRGGQFWQTDVPADSLDVPIIYFVVARGPQGRVASPMRIAQPRGLGLDEPTRLFWPFIEGFEQGFEGWRVVGGSELRLGSPAKSGKTALAIGIPAGQRSVTVVTPRLRGWFLEEHGATGVALWLRTRAGTGTARFALLADAFSTNQIVSRCEQAVTVGQKWRLASLSFATFPKLPLGEVDLFSIELTAAPGTEFLLDDVHLTGRWRVE